MSAYPLANLDHSLKVVLATNSKENPVVPLLSGVPVMNFLKTMELSKGYANLWGAQHQNVSKDEYSITLTLDRPSGITLLFPLFELEN